LEIVRRTVAGQALSIAALTIPDKSIFEATESNIIEVVGDPMEQIEEEFRP
jgi:hypothetical protein